MQSLVLKVVALGIGLIFIVLGSAAVIVGIAGMLRWQLRRAAAPGRRSKSRESIRATPIIRDRSNVSTANLNPAKRLCTDYLIGCGNIDFGIVVPIRQRRT